ncbi:hypothetical protein RAJCM14343_1514 [Rhodococcus aetherivorans]|uniref:Uncharacterized protein n=1 Tax=Rhodococcus aetherivorans TaxID=191292 RepID=A0ABQ0YID0_9NOCA|nr:hypothetical protein RAJCM14343_1514 [Rhodococcus aetherivorans]
MTPTDAHRETRQARDLRRWLTPTAPAPSRRTILPRPSTHGPINAQPRRSPQWPKDHGRYRCRHGRM